MSEKTGAFGPNLVAILNRADRRRVVHAHLERLDGHHVRDRQARPRGRQGWPAGAAGRAAQPVRAQPDARADGRRGGPLRYLRRGGPVDAMVWGAGSVAQTPPPCGKPGLCRSRGRILRSPRSTQPPRATRTRCWTRRRACSSAACRRKKWRKPAGSTRSTWPNSRPSSSGRPPRAPPRRRSLRGPRERPRPPGPSGSRGRAERPPDHRRILRPNPRRVPPRLPSAGPPDGRPGGARCAGMRNTKLRGWPGRLPFVMPPAGFDLFCSDCRFLYLAAVSVCLPNPPWQRSCRIGRVIAASPARSSAAAQ